MRAAAPHTEHACAVTHNERREMKYTWYDIITIDFVRRFLLPMASRCPNPVPSTPLLTGQEHMQQEGFRHQEVNYLPQNVFHLHYYTILLQLFLINGIAQGDLLEHRVSGYYTSIWTLNSTQPSLSIPPYLFPPIVMDTFGACFHKLRERSDLQLIRCVQDNVSSQRSYFVKPPLSNVTLFFKNKEMEKEYRENAYKASEGIGGNPPTLVTSRFNMYFDIFISALVYQRS
ncbi:hypothetical protein EAI_05834 [Harpegnathos saltator]|uniref:Uncharacterized protein n=1 Tax=Harpegnathos saltator TaxID=610380 RepID=E2BMS0_HARSA|nr:hypothetical protein EAI_05834 [Harpegnathos saltator]